MKHEDNKPGPIAGLLILIGAIIASSFINDIILEDYLFKGNEYFIIDKQFTVGEILLLVGAIKMLIYLKGAKMLYNEIRAKISKKISQPMNKPCSTR